MEFWEEGDQCHLVNAMSSIRVLDVGRESKNIDWEFRGYLCIITSKRDLSLG